MRNLFIDELDKKDVEHFTSDLGLYLRKSCDKPFKRLCNVFTNANIIKMNNDVNISDEEYFSNLDTGKIPLSNYDLKTRKNNIILERYPHLDENESYIFVCNHTCPEDIETVLNVLDRNAYLVLGSVESLKYNPEMYLSWLNGMIPFDILDNKQRKEVFLKMERVVKTNSILIFPEGSHNYHPNKIVNNLFDGPVNLSLKTGKKIVVVTLMKDSENNVSYIDVGNPVDFGKLDINIDSKYSTKEEKEKYYVKSISSCIRDKMATAVYHMMLRHFDYEKRADISDIESYFRQQCISDAFEKLKWERDVFDAEYLVKKTREEKEYEDVVTSLANLKLNMSTLKQAGLNHRDYVLKELDLFRKDVAQSMREHLIGKQNNEKKLVKRK